LAVAVAGVKAKKDAGCRMLDARKNPGIRHPASGIRHPASGIQHLFPRSHTCRFATPRNNENQFSVFSFQFSVKYKLKTEN
jgi:hypothetical protein